MGLPFENNPLFLKKEVGNVTSSTQKQAQGEKGGQVGTHTKPVISQDLGHVGYVSLPRYSALFSRGHTVQATEPTIAELVNPSLKSHGKP